MTNMTMTNEHNRVLCEWCGRCFRGEDRLDRDGGVMHPRCAERFDAIENEMETQT